jgi:transcriptional regulator with XRE-family HTH domain
MGLEPEERAKGIVLPDWWLQKVRELVEQRGCTLTDLGVDLAAAVGRDEAWDHSSVSRFLRNKNTTAPMAAAFAELFGIAPAFYMARTPDEADALRATARRYDAVGVNPEQARRLQVVDQIVEAEGESVRRRTDPVDSDNEGTSGRGRSRRAPRVRS